VNNLASDRSRMIELHETLDAGDGARPSRLPGVTLLRSRVSTEPVLVLYEPCIVIVAQGSKRFALPGRSVTYDTQRFLALTVPVSAYCETTVAENGPFLALAVRVDLTVLSELLSHPGVSTAAADLEEEPYCIAAPMTAALRDATIRLLECLGSTSDARILGPQYVREFLYRVLCTDASNALCGLLLGSEVRAQIHRALQKLHTEYSTRINISALARDVGMSDSALHAHFRAVTGASPLQYLKTIRLHRARTLMVQESIGAAAAAQIVGYDSASQFSREFKRFFGSSPTVESRKIRTAFGFAETP